MSIKCSKQRNMKSVISITDYVCVTTNNSQKILLLSPAEGWFSVSDVNNAI